MPTDLYSVDLASISATDLYKAIVDFTLVGRPIDDRPREGYLLDYKLEVGEKFLRLLTVVNTGACTTFFESVSCRAMLSLRLISITPALASRSLTPFRRG